MAKIVVLDAFSVNPGDLSWQAIEALGDVVFYDRTSPDEVVDRVKGADVVLTNKVRLNENHFQSLPRLKYIGVMATGFDVVDIVAAKARGIVVTNVPAYSTDHVAQLVFAHLLNITNYVDKFARENRSGRWTNASDFCYWDEPIHELASMTMGIVGLGNIGQKVAKIATAFGMQVLAYTSKAQENLPAGIEKCELDWLFTASDVISLHCPLNDSTRSIVREETILKMKPTAIVINTGRGPLVNEEDMATALKEKRIRAYAADVMSNEPPKADNPLVEIENAFLTPHIAWTSQEARVRLIDVLANNISAFLNGAPVNVVNK